MAHKKGVGSTDNGRDSKSKRLGVKLYGGQKAKAGNILIRQRGTEYHPGQNVYMGRDHTLHAAIDGIVTFTRTRNDRRYVSILPFEEVVETVAPVKKAAKPAVKTEAPKVETPVVEETAAPVVETVVDVAAEKPAKKEKAPAAEKKPAAKKGPKADDLKIVEGIGPKIETLLKDGGIDTWAALAAAPVERIKEILDAAGPRYQIHDPSTWPAQAKFAAEGKFEELKEYQDMLLGGRDVTE